MVKAISKLAKVTDVGAEILYRPSEHQNGIVANLSTRRNTAEEKWPSYRLEASYRQLFNTDKKAGQSSWLNFKTW